MTRSSEELECNAERRETIDAGTQPSIHVRIVPSIDNPSRSIIFDIVDRELKYGSTIRIGRYSERHANKNCMSFKSKVVSRCHCEVWTESDGKLYIRDTKSSSGTFLNHVRLSPAGTESKPVELHDGDIVQLGVDFQGGKEEMYRSVKMKFELNRSRKPRPLSFSLNAFQNIRNLTQQTEESSMSPTQKITDACDNTKHVEECCICLYALAPFQALFVSPCSHTYHYKCIRPLLSSYPGFQCPICRTYSDLEASVATEEEEEQLLTSNKPTDEIIVDEPLDIEPTTSSLPLQTTDTRLTAVIPSSNTISDNLPTPSSSENNVLQHVIDEIPSSSTNESSEYNEGVLSNTEEEEEEEVAQPSTSKRARRSSQFMEKIKMVFFEKRKSSSSSSQQRRRNKNKPRPLSYPNLFSNNTQNEEIPPLPAMTRASTSNNNQLSQTMSRQTTSYLPDIQETTVPNNQPHRSSRPFLLEAMILD